MMADGPKMRPVSWTVSEVEIEMLEQLIQWRHPTDPKAASMTVRECIRETYEREKAEREKLAP
ncbi:MAG TPA: hypothetical protein VFN78_02590 [Ktedonobacterales bacterium]|nr:hypothetical protein [Ktedonobacterales bacterium]